MTSGNCPANPGNSGSGAEMIPAGLPPLRSPDLVVLEQRGKLGILFAALCRACAEPPIVRQSSAGEIYVVTLGPAEYFGAKLAAGIILLRSQPGWEDLALWQLAEHNVRRVVLIGRDLLLVPEDIAAYRHDFAGAPLPLEIGIDGMQYALTSDRVLVREVAP